MNRTLRLYDPLLFWLALGATVLGMLFVFDAGYPRSIAAGHGAIPREFLMQLAFLPVAVAASVFCASQRPDKWKKAAKTLWWISFASLLLVFFPVIGVQMNGAHRWIKLGPVMIQPAEFVKVTCVLYLASVFADRKAWPAKVKYANNVEWGDRVLMPKIARAMPAVVVFFAVGLIEKEPDMGTGAIVAFAAFCMLFLGGVSRKSLIAATCIALFGVVLMVKQEPYRLERITNHAKRWDQGTMDDTGYQTVQSELAMASGGLLGTGVGNGRAKHVEPAATTDFILATVGEEFGFVGVLAVIAVMVGLVVRLLALAAKAPTRFGSLILSGCAGWIGIQAAVNIMMANGTLPAIGIPLPFISSGGSSLVALWMAMGVCQSVIAPQTAEEAEVAPSRHRWWHRRPRLSRA
jgi:cell division protein FtsW